MSIPDPDELFYTMGIKIETGEIARYVVGDGLDGYYDGRTGSHSSEAGYRHRAGQRFRFPLWYANGQQLKPDRATATIYPFGSRTLYPSGHTELLMVHSGRRAVTMQASCPEGSQEDHEPLRLIPIIDGVEEIATTEDPGTCVLRLAPGSTDDPAGSDCPEWAAVVCDRDGTTELTKDADFGQQLRCTAAAPTRSLRASIVFGYSRSEVLREVRELCASDPVEEEKKRLHELLTRSWFWTDDDPDFSRAVLWAVYAANTMVVHEFGTGIWAGLPWFKDYWGRDTFITLPGALLVTGRFQEARAVILSFANLQCTDPADPHYGRVPNRVTSLDNVIYNTTDGTPWMLREILEYLRYTGDRDFAHEIYPAVERAIEGALRNYIDAEGFLTHHAADTWMDAKFNPAEAAGESPATTAAAHPDADNTGLLPWSARGNRAVEIQVLWFTALEAAVWLADHTGHHEHREQWQAAADTLAANFLGRFWDADRQRLADRLLPGGSPDFTVRPNQLMLLSLPFEQRPAPPDVELSVVKAAVPQLVLPHGVLSLNQDHQDARGRCYFHPYHDNRPEFHKDAAYHNGAIWHWNAGFTVSALVRCGMSSTAYRLSSALTDQILHIGCRGSLSENMDPFPDENEQLTPSGTFSQAWSVSEFARVAYQDYAGCRPNLLENKVELIIGAPASWTRWEAVYALGNDGSGDPPLRLHARFSTPSLPPASLGTTASPATDGTSRVVEARLVLCGQSEDLTNWQSNGLQVTLTAFHNAHPQAAAATARLRPNQEARLQLTQQFPAQEPELARLQRNRSFEVMQQPGVMHAIIARNEYTRGV